MELQDFFDHHLIIHILTKLYSSWPREADQPKLFVSHEASLSRHSPIDRLGKRGHMKSVRAMVLRTDFTRPNWNWRPYQWPPSIFTIAEKSRCPLPAAANKAYKAAALAPKGVAAPLEAAAAWASFRSFSIMSTAKPGA